MQILGRFGHDPMHDIQVRCSMNRRAWMRDSLKSGIGVPSRGHPLIPQHYNELAKSLLYIGVSRGKRLVGKWRALAMVIRNGAGRRLCCFKSRHQHKTWSAVASAP